jgi:hypothetical protein
MSIQTPTLPPTLKALEKHPEFDQLRDMYEKLDPDKKTVSTKERRNF